MIKYNYAVEGSGAFPKKDKKTVLLLVSRTMDGLSHLSTPNGHDRKSENIFRDALGILSGADASKNCIKKC